MATITEQIEEIEATLRKTPHHKATNGFIGAMRAKIARLKDKEIESSNKSGGGGGGGFTVKKQGDATIVLVGPPSAGKSTLINLLTNAESKVAPYAFTTVTVIPGMFKYKEAYIQMLDIPGLIEGARQGKGRGREVLSVARGADLLIIMTDIQRLERIAKMVEELEKAGIRINKTKPSVLIEKKVSGGLNIHSNIKQEFDNETVKGIAREYGIKSGDISIKEKLSINRLFDSFSVNRVYIPAIFVVNKADISQPKANDNYVYISAKNGMGIDNLIASIWKEMKFVTVKIINGSLIMKDGDSLNDVATKIGSDFSQNVKLAKIWGSGALFPGQEVSLSTQVKDGMEIHFL
ncbi:MAG: GTPase [Patescibacteria group bacterium]